MVTALTRLFLLLGLAFSISLYLLSDTIADLLQNPELAVALKIFSPFPLFTLPTMGVEGIYTALRKTKYLAVYHVVSKCVMLLCIVLPVICFHTGYKEALIGWGLASFFIFLFSMYLKNAPYVNVQKEKIKNMFSHVFCYSMPLWGAYLSDLISGSADQFFISRYYGTTTFAEAANGCFSIPIVAMVANSMKSVLMPVLSKAGAEGRMSEALHTYRNGVMRTVNIVFPILLFTMFFAKDILTLLFGVQYAVSATYLKIFILRDFSACFPYLAVLMALGQNKFYLNLHIAGVLYVWVIDALLVKSGACPEAFVGVSSSLQILMRTLSFIYIYKVSGLILFKRDTTTHLLTVALHSLACVMMVGLLSEYLFEFNNRLVCLLSNGILYCLVLVISGHYIQIDYIESIKSLRRR
jgi:O-antigen/teichoic acid export membrane protein